MKFDPKQPHGVVYNHYGAAFEQNGKLFTGSGDLFEDEVATLPDPTPAPASDISVFIKEQLKGGPVAQANLYKESAEKGYVWADVKSVAADMKVSIKMVKGATTWSMA